jgi:hypothetical protein
MRWDQMIVMPVRNVCTLRHGLSSSGIISWLNSAIALTSGSSAGLAPHRCCDGPSALKMEAAEEPEHKQDNQYQAQNAPKPGSAIAPITVVATTAPEQQDEHDN